MRDATYDPNDHYWHVLDRAQVWSSARCAYIAGDDQTYAAWRKGGGLTTRIASEGELWDVLAEQAPDKLPDEPAVQERRRERILGNVDAATLKVFLAQENRLRALEGKASITGAQFRSALKADF